MCTGPLSAFKPGAEVKRFKACNVRVRGVEGMSVLLQEVEGLKKVAAVLRSTGLVQVDEVHRTFGMHQLLQKAVGEELGWQLLCERMQALLHERCGQFGDEAYFDAGLYGIMREVMGAAAVAVARVREEGGGQGLAWCSGMLLRLTELARDVHGSTVWFTVRVFAAAHGSLVADLVRAHVMQEGCKPAGRCMTLASIAHAAQHIRDIFAQDPDFTLAGDSMNEVLEEISKGVSSEAAADIVTIRRFDLRKCLVSHWGRGAQTSLVAQLVRSQVMQEGYTVPEGKMMPMQDIAAVPLIKDLMDIFGLNLRDAVDSDSGQRLKDACGIRVVDDGYGGSSVLAQAHGEREAAGESDNFAGAEGERRLLRAMCWKLLFLIGRVEARERTMHDVGAAYEREEEVGGKWEVGVALGAACHAAGVKFSELQMHDKCIAAFERASRLRTDTLGEQHPDTAFTLNSMVCCYAGNVDASFLLHERAMHIFKNTLGQHPATAVSMSFMGVSFVNKKQHRKAVELYEQALRIYERTVGRMHKDAADAIYNMSVSSFMLGDRVKAEELGQEALEIWTLTLGHDSDHAVRARNDLVVIRKAKGKGGTGRR